MLVEKGLEVGTETQALLNVCYEGKKIPDELILGFVEEEIKVHPMTILLDYPTTYHQAVQLTDRLANVRPHDLM